VQTLKITAQPVIRATLINLRPRQRGWRANFVGASALPKGAKLISLRKCVNFVDIRIKVAPIASTFRTQILIIFVISVFMALCRGKLTVNVFSRKI
jgi:hypothetical protein